MRKLGIFIAITVTIAAIAVVSLPGGASAALFIKFDGIDGESTERDHRHWNDIDSVQWGVTMARTVGHGGAGKPVFSDLNWMQVLDKSVPKLFDKLTDGKVIRTATVDFTTRLGEDMESTYFQMIFTGVLITSLDVSGTSESRANLSGSFFYDKIKMIYTEYGPDGRKLGQTEAEYDLGSAKGSVGALVGLYALGMEPPLGPATVPVPATLWLLGAGLAGLAGVRRRLTK